MGGAWVYEGQNARGVALGYTFDGSRWTAQPMNPGLTGLEVTSLHVTPGGRAYANLYEFGEPVFTADANDAQRLIDELKAAGHSAVMALPVLVIVIISPALLQVFAQQAPGGAVDPHVNRAQLAGFGG